MEKQKKYWIIGIIIALILIVLIAWGFTSGNNKENVQDPHAGHNHAKATQKQTEAFTGLETPTTTTDKENALNQYLKEQDTIMSEMMANMEVEPSGNASIDFLKGMIPHHDSAIEMSESYLKYGGSNTELKKLAEDIIKAQTGEIEQMNDMIRQLDASGKKDEEKEKGYMDAYNKMMASHQHMNHGSPSAQDVEQAFAEGMMMHHQMAVDMAKAILDYTDEEEVRQLSQTIIDAQEKEIEQMKGILK